MLPIRDIIDHFQVTTVSLFVYPSHRCMRGHIWRLYIGVSHGSAILEFRMRLLYVTDVYLGSGKKGCRHLLLPKLPKFLSQCYINGQCNLDNLGRKKETQPKFSSMCVVSASSYSTVSQGLLIICQNIYRNHKHWVMFSWGERWIMRSNDHYKTVLQINAEK